MPYGEFKDLAREAYVEVASEDFMLPQKKQSASRISVLTGINRKDVSKLQKDLENEKAIHPKRKNRVYRVTSGWIVDPDFNEGGNTKELPIDGPKGEATFAELVRRYSGDVTVKALLDEMIRLKTVKVDNSHVRLLEKAYLPDDEDRFRIAGQAIADLVNTLDYNLREKDTPNHVQRMVAYDDIPIDQLEKIRHLSAQEIQQLLVRINGWLANYDRSNNPGVAGKGRARAGVGIYYFENIPRDLTEDTTEVEDV